MKTPDRRFTLNGAAFYYDYKNLQVGFVNANNIVETINAASARNYGIELEATFRPTPSLNVSAYATYLNARFKDFCNGYYRKLVTGQSEIPACPTDPALVDLSGKRLANAPDVTVGGSIDWTADLGGGKLVLGGDINMQSEAFFTEFNNADARQESFFLINASATYHLPGDRFSIQAWGRNLTNEYVIANNIVAAGSYAYPRVGSIRPPRTYGVTLGVEF